MQTFDDFQAALEEAKYCAVEERFKYYVFQRDDRYVVRKKHSSVRLQTPHIEVGFEYAKLGRPPDVE
jgi:hypothetical protein